MQWSSLQRDEQQELWNTLEILMHGKTAAEVRCAQQRLETMRSRLLPHLPPATQTILSKVFRAAACASHGGEQRFYWISEVESHWRMLLKSLESKRPAQPAQRSERTQQYALVR